MSDSIYRQVAIDAFGLSEKTRKYGGDHSGYDTMMLYEIQDVLESLPSADRPTGEWEIKTETDEYGLKRPKLVCSKCEKEPAAWDLTELFEFCPNCGAVMKGGEDE